MIISPVFEAGEKPIVGADQAALISGLQSFGHRDVLGINGPEDITTLIAEIANPGDLVIFLGAGSVSQWAYDLPKALQEALK